LKAADQDIFHQRGMPSLFVVQHVLIARVDDTSQFLAENSAATKCFDFVLWQKNVCEERKAQNQIPIGAMDHCHCALLALGARVLTFLESEVQGGFTSCLVSVTTQLCHLAVQRQNTRCREFSMIRFSAMKNFMMGLGSAREPPCSKTCICPC
jgi:hypothetical protein